VKKSAAYTWTFTVICRNQGLEQLGSRGCYHGEMDAILYRFEGSFD